MDSPSYGSGADGVDTGNPGAPEAIVIPDPGVDTTAFAPQLAPFVGSAGISLGLHAVLLIAFSLATWAVNSAMDSGPGDFGAQLVTEAPPIGVSGGFRFPGHAMTDQPDASTIQGPRDSTRELSALLEKSDASAIAPAPSGDTGLGTILNNQLRRSDIVGVGGAGGGAGQGGAGSGMGDRDVASGGPVGGMWGVGEGQNARSVIYVMDRSGSMSDTFVLLQRELMKAIGTLNSDQLFNVIWFNEGKATELFPRLKQASLENKRDAFDAIKTIVPSGRTQPLDALRRSLNYRPDVMFLLSDGDFGEDNKRVIQTIKQLNAARRCRINTILFVYDTMGEGERVLREIADENGGVYKHVTEEDIRQ